MNALQSGILQINQIVTAERHLDAIVALAVNSEAGLALRKEAQCQGGRPRRVHFLQARCIHT